MHQTLTLRPVPDDDRPLRKALQAEQVTKRLFLDHLPPDLEDQKKLINEHQYQAQTKHYENIA